MIDYLFMGAIKVGVNRYFYYAWWRDDEERTEHGFCDSKEQVNEQLKVLCGRLSPQAVRRNNSGVRYIYSERFATKRRVNTAEQSVVYALCDSDFGGYVSRYPVIKQTAKYTYISTRALRADKDFICADTAQFKDYWRVETDKLNTERGVYSHNAREVFHAKPTPRMMAIMQADGVINTTLSEEEKLRAQLKELRKDMQQQHPDKGGDTELFKQKSALFRATKAKIKALPKV